MTTDIAGHKFGRLTAIKAVGKQGRIEMWECVCECGGSKVARKYNIKKGLVRSCGCLESESRGRSSITHGQAGRRKTPEYISWQHMRARCLNKKSPFYKDYGGRGISVCEEWLNSFETFYADMGCRPTPTSQLDRIDNNSGYSRENCRWAEPLVQANNKRNTVFIEYQGKLTPISVIAREHGIPADRLRTRLKQGWGIDTALSTPRLSTKMESPYA